MGSCLTKTQPFPKWKHLKTKVHVALKEVWCSTALAFDGLMAFNFRGMAVMRVKFLGLFAFIIILSARGTIFDFSDEVENLQEKDLLVLFQAVLQNEQSFYCVRTHRSYCIDDFLFTGQIAVFDIFDRGEPAILLDFDHSVRLLFYYDGKVWTDEFFDINKVTRQGLFCLVVPMELLDLQIYRF